jgi:cytochrome oxidase Cu insertion factor (SCO1/SenC/PrrC family)
MMSIRQSTNRLLAILGVILSCASVTLGQSPPTTHLKAGDPAPDLELRDQDRNVVRLSDFKGKKSVVLAFYVLAFTGG